MKQMIGNNLRQCLFWHQANEKSFTISDPITANNKEPRTEKDFKAATAVARPGYLPEVLNEEWLWKWNAVGQDHNNHIDHQSIDNDHA